MESPCLVCEIARPLPATAMKAAYIERYGADAEVKFGDRPQPQAGPGQVLVQVHAASVNPVDFKIRAGKARAVLPFALPLILGSDFSGVIVDVGAGVDGFVAGDAVFGRQPLQRLGCYAEYVVADADCIARKPESIGHVEAAAVPLAALTAWQALFERGGLRSGHRVLIHGGAGGVGLFAIELAHAAGAWVATTTSAGNQALARAHGADLAIDHRGQRFEDLAQDLDLVLDTQGGSVRQRSWGCLRAGGTLVSVAGLPDRRAAQALGLSLPLQWLFHLANGGARRAARRHGVHFEYLFMHASGEQLAQIAQAVDRGAVRPVLDRVFSLSEVAQALAWCESGRRQGKVAIRVR